ncbi:hypothetical protein ASPZODRAFT_14020 [Penicilliopsis zonata CBS 506.65]|uniref:Uncharacterized protein n=1 Tax=Penicilliopsis zonata CBS 506.65 TaxID=1073090 RepID=A0A1L9SQ57_9EURO|nr:hypothetical protein ASPZODRAFT_14020 [Penicilliopsis zonata CBS 506.65]OJJ49298.1 hypothetical protein ASPZODRAFT_14020 [Penicilliopsis zonata CBS 506.65]
MSSEAPRTAGVQLSSNFATKRLSIGYDHEAYLELTDGKGEAKTPSQVYAEERNERLKSRAEDPAVFSPKGDPGPTDFECVQNKAV